MTAVVTPPSLITKQEQLVMWAIMALDETSPQGAVLESGNLVSFYVQWQVSKTPEGKEVFIGRVVLPLENISALPTGSKPWLQALDLPQGATVPAYYGSN